MMEEEARVKLDTEGNSIQKQSWIDKHVSYTTLLFIFFFANTITYLERVVISGSSEKILEFVRKSIPTHENTYFGALSSAFILGYSVTSVIFGYWVTRKPPFKVTSFGLICWLIASLMSGLAPNYWVLLIARMISGVGEASFHIVVPSYINDTSPRSMLGTSMALLYAGTPIGTALGFILSGWVSQNYSWRYMYLFVAPLMLPLIIIINSISFTPKRDENDKMTFMQATWTLLKKPLFIFACITAAAGIYLCGSYLAFGNQLLIHLGFFDNEAISSLAYGTVCCVAGVVGSWLGGWALNRFGVKETDTPATTMVIFSKHLMVCASICFLFCGLTALVVHSRVLFLLFFFFGFTGIFMSNPSWNLIVLNAAPPLVRPMAIAVSILFNHIFGDVPGPILTGRFLDACLRWAGGDEHRKWLSYVFTHLFILLSLIIVVSAATIVLCITKKAYRKEQEGLISQKHIEQVIDV